MDEPVQWLRTQLDEDERIGRAATPGPWHAQDGGVVSDDDEQWPVAGTQSERDRADRVHIAEHDPVRVLREIESKRALLEPHEPTMNPSVDSDLDNLDDQSTWLPVCSTCQSTIAHPGDWPCLPVRLLLAPYSDRPGYRKEWQP